MVLLRVILLVTKVSIKQRQRLALLLIMTVGSICTIPKQSMFRETVTDRTCTEYNYMYNEVLGTKIGRP